MALTHNAKTVLNLLTQHNVCKNIDDMERQRSAKRAIVAELVKYPEELKELGLLKEEV